MSVLRLVLISFLTLISFGVSAQSCYNADFELGNFSGWSGKRGECCPIVLPNNGIVNGRQTIMSPGIDPNTCGGLSTVYSGDFSARLGNDNIGAEAEGLYFTFNITPQSTLVQYAYAVVFEDPGHTPDEQPRFTSRVRLPNGSVISCTDYTVTAASNLSGFQYCAGVDNQGDPVNIAWRDWSTVTVDLSLYIGQTVTLEFETGDCSLGGHFGYAYIDAISCSSTQIDVNYCVNQTSAVLSAPAGFQSYLWETGETTQSITVNPLLYDSLSCFLTTITGCELTLNTALQPSIPTPIFSYTGECQGNIIFNNTSTISNGGQGTYLWDFGDGTTSSQFNPSHNYLFPGNYTVTLTVTTDNGCDAQTTQNITIYPQPVSNFSVVDNCLGDFTQFNNLTNPIPGYLLDFQWNFGNNSGSNQFSPNYTYPNSGTFNTSLIVSVSGTSCRDTLSRVVNIRANPQALFLVDNSCQGVVTNFINTTQLPNWQNSTQYLWNFDEGGATSLLTSPNFVYSTEGLFNPTLTVSISDGNLTCVSEISNPVNIYPNPGVIFLSQPTGCVGDTIQFTNLSTISSSSEIINYVWDFGNGQLSNLISPSIVFSNSSLNTVTLTATSDFGCSRNFQNQILINPLPNITSTNNSMCQGQLANLTAQGSVFYNWTPSNTLLSSNSSVAVSNAIQTTVYTVVGTDINGCSNSSQSIMTVNPTPQIIVNGGEICQGNSIQLTAFGANSYSWSPVVGLNSVNTQNVTSTPPGSVTYTITGTDINGCVGTGFANVIVNENPIVSVNSGSVCLGKSITLNASGAANYFWSPAVFLNTNSGSEVISSPNSNVDYTVIGIDQNGCRDTSYSNIVVLPLSTVNFTPNQDQGCPPLTTEFFELVTDSLINLTWSFGDGTYSNQSNPVHTYENSGTYYVSLEVTNQYGCKSESNFISLVNVYPEPTANFSVFSPILDEMNPFVNTINYSIGSTEYSWNFGDGNFSNSFEPNHRYENAGDYLIDLIVQNEFGCKDTASVFVTIKPVFTFFIPNAFTPSRKLNEVFFGKGTNYKTVQMQIFNRWGERIFEQTSSQPPIWDGTYKGEDCQIDVYVYQFFVTDIFDELHVYRGRVTLVR